MKTFINQGILDINQDDLLRLSHIDSLFFDYPWKSRDWLDLANSEQHCLIFDEHYNFILFYLSPLEEMAHLLKILVLPEFRRQGLAQLLFQKAVKTLNPQGYKSLFLEVRENNEGAINFYLKNDFKKLELVQKYYSDGQNAWRMMTSF